MRAVTHKISVSVQDKIWKNLSKHKNRSFIINQALEFFFDKEEKIKQAEEKYWEKVLSSLSGKNNNYDSLNPNKEKINHNLLEEKLWK